MIRHAAGGACTRKANGGNARPTGRADCSRNVSCVLRRPFDRRSCSGAEMTAFAPLPASPRDEATRGILYALAAVLTFAAVNALTKWEVARYPITEVVLFRSIFALVPCAGLVAANGGR